ncbi:MAG: folylpolyglutamate synthase/dihydrofolate synthase family protein [candidate division WOR-3 bacterium]
MKAEEFLNSLINYEKIPGYKYDLEAYKKFLKRLGSPQGKLKNVILIAGTKGKGSTATMINSCLIASGYRVGLFTSPHLLRITERIRINNQEITQREMEKYIRRIKPYINPVRDIGSNGVNFKTRIGARTFFEVLTTIAFMYFAEKKVDFAVLEVGLGGRLDATNVFNSHIPVITRIGYDHMNLLGNKLSKIAYEKAGIIPIPSNPPLEKWEKDGFCITIHQRPSINGALQKVAYERNHRIIFADDLHKIMIKKITTKRTELNINGALGRFDVSLPLIGRHQIENLQIALTVLFKLKKQGIKISISSIKTGIRNARLPGRFEILSKKPLIIYDVAHNEDSFKALMDNLKLLRDHLNRFYVIFGCNKDKDISYALKKIFPKAKEVLLIKANNPRAMEPFEIYEKAKNFQKNITIASSMKNALEYVITKKGYTPAVVIFGSFYLYSDLIKTLNSIRKKSD